MTHDDILKAARARIAEIDKQTAAMAEERGKLAAMLGAPPVATWAKPIEAAPLPTLDTCPMCRRQRWTFGEATMCGCSLSVRSFPGLDYMACHPYVPCDGTVIAIGGPQRLPSDLHFTS